MLDSLTLRMSSLNTIMITKVGYCVLTLILLVVIDCINSIYNRVNTIFIVFNNYHCLTVTFYPNDNEGDDKEAVISNEQNILKNWL